MKLGNLWIHEQVKIGMFERRKKVDMNVERHVFLIWKISLYSIIFLCGQDITYFKIIYS